LAAEAAVALRWDRTADFSWLSSAWRTGL